MEMVEAYLGIRGVKHVVDMTDGVGSHADVPKVKTDTMTTANVTEIVSTPRK